MNRAQAKRLLPARLSCYRKRLEGLAVIRKRDAHDSRLQEERQRRAIKQRLALTKKARKVIKKRAIAEVNAAIAEREKQAA